MPLKEFFGKYFDPIVKGEAEARPTSLITLRELLKRERPDLDAGIASEHSDPWYEFRDFWAIRLLRTAAADNDAEGCKRLLSYILSNLQHYR